MVVPGGVQGELAEEFAGGGVDDADVEVVDEDQDAGVGVGSADADVVESAGVAQGEFSELVDAVGAYPVVGVGARCWVGFGSGGGGGGLVRERAVWSAVVVLVEEGVELGL